MVSTKLSPLLCCDHRKMKMEAVTRVTFPTENLHCTEIDDCLLNVFLRKISLTQEKHFESYWNQELEHFILENSNVIAEDLSSTNSRFMDSDKFS